MSKKALITGITGQDGSYLAEFLLDKGYEVHGIVRRSSLANTGRIDHLLEKNAVKLHDGDLSDSSSIIRIVGEVQPDEIYNLAAQSHVQVSFDAPGGKESGEAGNQMENETGRKAVTVEASVSVGFQAYVPARKSHGPERSRGIRNQFCR